MYTKSVRIQLTDYQYASVTVEDKVKVRKFIERYFSKKANRNINTVELMRRHLSMEAVEGGAKLHCVVVPCICVRCAKKLLFTVTSELVSMKTKGQAKH